MATLLDTIRSERKGVALKDGPTARIRMAFLAGERLGRADLKRLGASSTSMIHMAMADLKRVGYRFDSEQVAPPKRGGLPTVVHWVTNPKHVPRTDSGPTREYRPRKKRTSKPAPEPAFERPALSSQSLPLGLTFTLIAAFLGEDGAVNYHLSDGNGTTLLGIEQ